MNVLNFDLSDFMIALIFKSRFQLKIFDCLFK